MKAVKEVQLRNSDRLRGASKALTLTNLLSVANSLFHIARRRLERWTFALTGRAQRRKPQGSK
jgi:hypothetical protein